MLDQQSVILVVEDDETVRDLLALVLADNPEHAVTAVSNGAEALVFLDAVRPHLITLDITMPGIDGIALYKLIRARAALNDVPVLFISAQDRGRTSLLNGRFQWLHKPFEITKLEEAVTALLAETRLIPAAPATPSRRSSDRL